jgi:TolB protein
MLFSSAHLAAQEQDSMRIEIVRGNINIPLAVPAFVSEGVGQKYRDAAEEITTIVRNDLMREGIFRLADDVVYEQIGRHTENNIPFDQYSQFKLDALVLGKIQPDPKGFRVEARLLSVQDKSSIFGKAYYASDSQIRLVAHKIASQILYHFTGQFGIYESHIIFASNRELTDPNYNSEIWIMDWDGAEQKRITYSASLKQFPTYGPGDSGIVYTSFINNNADIYHLKLSEGAAIKLFSSKGADFAPALSPDGTRVAFSSSSEGYNTDIYVCNVDGSNVKRLTTHRAIDSSPCWSPDGKRISFTSGRTGTVQIYTMNADGSNQQRITYEGRYNDGADWSPDGRYIAYASRRDGSKTFDIKIHDLVTNQTYYVTRDVENDENPSFSPDGKSIAFASDRSGQYQIYTIDIDGRNMRQLTFAGINKHPSWSR